MAVDIDRLQIEIEATSSDAASKIDQLATALTNLKSAAKGGAGLTPVTKQLREIVSVASGASNVGRNISQMVSALKGLSQIKTPKGLSSLANQLDKLKVSVSGANGSEIADTMTALSNGVRAFSSIGNVKISSSIANQLSAIQTAVSGIKWTDGDKIEALANGLRPLSQLGKAQLTTFINQLSKLPSVIEELDKADLDKFATQMNQVASAMRPLATEMQKVANGFSAFPIRIQKIIQSNSALTASNNKTAKSFGVLGTGISRTWAKFSVYLIAFSQIARVMSDWVKSANEYIENVNLFQVSMGEFYEEAFAYAELVSDRLGIDPSEWMRAQGVFMSMANGFGLAREQAYALSEGLTELSYDLSSLYNEDVEQSMLRLQSALSGEIEPIRRLGVSITQATLEEYALAHGIDESVAAMTEQEKALLRSLVLMEGAGRIGAIGDFAKTLESPANAMRVLNQQITQLGRALGTVLLPIIIQLIPWAQAFVEVLTDAVRALATLVGFTMPEWDTQSWEMSGGLASDAVDDVTDSVKALKSATLGIDELNIISPNSGSGAASGAGVSGWADELEIPEIWDKDMIAQIETQAEQLKKQIEKILPIVVAIGAAFAAWKIATGLTSGILSVEAGVRSISTAIGLLANLAPVKAAIGWIAGAATAIAIQFNAAGGGVSGFLAALKLVGTTAAPALAIFTVIISTLKVLVERWDDIKQAVFDVVDKLGISERLGDLQGKLDELGLKLGWTEGFWNGLKGAIEGLMDLIGGTVITVIGSVLIGVFNGLIEVIGGVISVITGVIDILSGLATFIVGVFTGDLQTAGEGVDLLLSGIQSVFGGLWQAVVGGVTQFVNGVINSISDLGGTLLHESLPGILDGFVNFWGDVVTFFTEAVPSWWNETIAPWFTVEKWKEIGQQAIDGLFAGLSNIWEAASSWGKDLLSDIKNVLGIHSPSTEFEAIGEYSVAGLERGFSSLSKVSSVFTTQIGVMKNTARVFSNDVYIMIDTTLAFLLSSLVAAKNENQTFVDGISAMYRTMASQSNSAIQSIISYLDSIPRSITTIHTIITKTKSSGGSANEYASGGFPDTGQMFIARESGPELVGSIGRRTAVANNEQIVEGITAGVAEANMSQNALLREQNELLRAILAKEGVTYISDKQIKRAYDRANRNSGATIMAGGVVG